MGKNIIISYYLPIKILCLSMLLGFINHDGYTQNIKKQGKIQAINSSLFFIENKGQMPDSILFSCPVKGGGFYFLKDGFYMTEIQNNMNLKDLNADLKNAEIKGHTYKVQFNNISSSTLSVSGDKKLITKINFLTKQDIAKDYTGCNTFETIIYHNVYSNIDIKFYISNDELKYDIVVNPQGRLSDVSFTYLGVSDMRVKNNRLQYKTSLSTLQEHIPSSYIINSSNLKNATSVNVNVNNNEVSFHSPEYDYANSTLVVDPTLVFASFSGSRPDNWGFTATYGADGSFYLGGIVYTNFGVFNVTPGAFQRTFGNIGKTGSGRFFRQASVSNPSSCDVVITKFSADGSKVLYATYLGGPGDELPNSLVEDSKGNLIIFGRADNTKNFPNNNLSSYGALGNYDIFITKLNVTGSNIIKSWIIGGTGSDGVNLYESYYEQKEFETNKFYSDMTRGEVILDPQDNIYMVSQTRSTDFPFTTNAPQQTYGGGTQDGVVLKISSDMGVILLSSYLGGSATDAAFVVNINKINNDIYVAGTTLSNNMPGLQPNVLKNSIDKIDGFVTRIDNNRYNIVNTTYIGTSKDDFVYGIQSDKQGAVYVMGVTTGMWPVINSAYSTVGKQFVGKMSNDLSKWIYTTRFGTNSLQPNISPVAFLVDRCQNVYISGFGKLELTSQHISAYSTTYSMAGTMGLETTPNALDRTTDGGDFYFIVIERDAKSLLYATFYGIEDEGASSGEHVDGGTSRFDPNGVVYQGICGYCGGARNNFYPTTPFAAFRNKGSLDCNMLGLKIDFELSGVISQVYYVSNGKINKDTICVGDKVEFKDKAGFAEKYYWLFGDGTPEVETTVSYIDHIFTQTGTYNVRLITYLATSCNVRDTSYVQIVVDNNHITPDFKIERDLVDCNIMKFKVTNISTTRQGQNIANYLFKWDFGDGTVITTQQTSVEHTYASEGAYNISLTPVNFFCNTGESNKKELNVVRRLKATFIVPKFICINDNFQLINTSNGGITYQWFLDGNLFSTERSPTMQLKVTRKYTVKVIVYDPTTCNKVDELTQEFEVIRKVFSNFKYEFKKADINLTPVFYNLSIDAISYEWDFGDGSSIYKTTDHDLPVIHNYGEGGTYRICLSAINLGCKDLFCKSISLNIYPNVLAPNAFSPNNDGLNDVLYFKVSGGKQVQIKIYNRYGQIVYESNDRTQGWDGTLNGTKVPADVYSYIIDIEDYEGKTTNFKDNITLIR